MLYNRIIQRFLKQYKPAQAKIEATCLMLDLSLKHGFLAVDWKGW